MTPWPPWQLKIVLSAGAGHRAEWTVTKEDIEEKIVYLITLMIRVLFFHSTTNLGCRLTAMVTIGYI